MLIEKYKSLPKVAVIKSFYDTLDDYRDELKFLYEKLTRLLLYKIFSLNQFKDDIPFFEDEMVDSEGFLEVDRYYFDSIEDSTITKSLLKTAYSQKGWGFHFFSTFANLRDYLIESDLEISDDGISIEDLSDDTFLELTCLDSDFSDDYENRFQMKELLQVIKEIFSLDEYSDCGRDFLLISCKPLASYHKYKNSHKVDEQLDKLITSLEADMKHSFFRYERKASLIDDVAEYWFYVPFNESNGWSNCDYLSAFSPHFWVLPYVLNEALDLANQKYNFMNNT